MLINTAKLTDFALDWAVAKCEGAMYCIEELPTRQSWESMGEFNTRYLECKSDGFGIEKPSYSTNWAQGGPIIERKKINLRASVAGDWAASTHDLPHPERIVQHGDTPLIAAMRCYVESRIGPWVEIPDELL